MSRLRIFSDTNPDAPDFTSHDGDEIARELAKIGVRFERWQASQPVAAGASQEEVIAAYKADIDRISAERGFTTVDVISISPDNPKKDELRAKFLDEHFHKEDEVRFFVEGSGTFYLHIYDTVYGVVCEAGDLLSVPEGATHWFDMGVNDPQFCAIRFFHDGEGWVGDFTGEKISASFPGHDELIAGK